MRLRKFSNKKFKNPQERAKNLSEALKGKHCSPRTEFKKGHKGYSGMLNKKHSKETKKKMREAKLKNPPKWMIGKHPTSETRLKQRKAKLGKPTWNKGKRCPQLARENNPNWKGGITPLVLQIRHCFKYRQWRSDVFTRDDYTCQKCGVRSGIIHADHYPKKFSIIFQKNNIKSLEQAENCEEFWNINNGRTLCKICHRAEGSR